MRWKLALALIGTVAAGEAAAKMISDIPAAPASDTFLLSYPGEPLFAPARDDQPPGPCHDTFRLTGEWTAPTVQDRRVRRQISIDHQGTIENILFLTRAGWRRYHPAILAQIKRYFQYLPPMRGRNVGCWFEEDAYWLGPLVPTTEQPIRDEPIDLRNLPAGATLPRSANSHRVRRTDFPFVTDERGAATVKMLILTDGSVGRAAIEESSGAAEIDDAALKLVHRWFYYPATHDGRPVAMWIHAKIVVYEGDSGATVPPRIAPDPNANPTTPRPKAGKP